MKIRERKGPSLGVIQTSYLHERSPCAPKVDDSSRGETSRQERAGALYSSTGARSAKVTAGAGALYSSTRASAA